jgi:Dullard-like phosphatase family protein
MTELAQQIPTALPNPIRRDSLEPLQRRQASSNSQAFTSGPSLSRKSTEPHLSQRRNTQPQIYPSGRESSSESEDSQKGSISKSTPPEGIQGCVANQASGLGAGTAVQDPNGTGGAPPPSSMLQLPHPPTQGNVFAITNQKKNLSPLVPGTFTPLLPPRSPTMAIVRKNTLILDIDETLVHASVEPQQCDIKIPVVFKGVTGNVYVKLRPNVVQFLDTVCDLFEVITFTASLPLYASPLMDVLDPRRKMKGRLYREHCSNFGGLLVKDLARLGRPLERCVIIDNTPQAFALQPRNGIPIKSFVGDRDDDELMSLLPLLARLADADDVYPFLDAYNSGL